MKALKIIAGSLAGLITAVLITAAVYALIQPVLYRDYYEVAKKEFPVAGLSDGMIPQGFAYIPEKELFLQCGYMYDSTSPGRVYITDKNGDGRYVEFFMQDGSPYTGHAGGITVGGKTVWLADGDAVWAIPMETLLTESTVTLKESFEPESRASCCFADGEYLWICEFYRPEKYETKESHHMTTPAGDEHHAIVCAYRIDEDKEGGIASTTPEKILSITDQVQGIAINSNGEFALSTSYGTASSHLLFYENVLEKDAAASFEVNGTQVPVWFLDSDSLIKELSLPPMSEEITIANGRLYVTFESASHKYRFGILTRGRNVYSLPF